MKHLLATLLLTIAIWATLATAITPVSAQTRPRQVAKTPTRANRPIESRPRRVNTKQPAPRQAIPPDQVLYKLYQLLDRYYRPLRP